MTYLKNKLLEKQRKYLRRKQRVNTQIKLTHPEYRAVISKSNLYVSVEVIAANGNTLASCSDKGVAGATKTERAHNAGLTFAETLKSKKIDKVTFDRNGYLYHGRVKAFAEGLRQGGIVL
ncbi:MAG: 50S ribosomal protein L18 [Candidatus Absconditabacteria bacterium]|nr:50S ribosomal protein L18 [Candidatus Absconditabacteria bacterium]MDD3868419.1 50S ribosomal protein L18 [Candidatus Absconditabacteria bacterium]MDD4714057.1 50S ribosomal protein L18 [Candidatus Absconditabacteria bacterium]